MTKGIEWLKKEIEKIDVETSENFPHYDVISKNVVLYAINQLDEPEVLSQKWIDEYAQGDYDEWVYTEDLQNLLVPKQEKIKVNKEDFENIKSYKEEGWALVNLLNNRGASAEHDEMLAKAWLAYPNIEVEKEVHPILKAFDEKAKEYESYGSTSMRMAEVRKVLVEALEEEEE